MDSRKSWSKKNFVNKCKDKEITILWSHHETQLSRNEYHPRNLFMKEEKRTKTQLSLTNRATRLEVSQGH